MLPHLVTYHVERGLECSVNVPVVLECEPIITVNSNHFHG